MSGLLQKKEEIEARLLAADPSCSLFLYHGTSYHDRLDVLDPKPEGFVERGAGEYTNHKCVAFEYGLRVDGLTDLMKLGVQVFALKDEAMVDEFSYDWPSLTQDNERAYILDTGSKGGMFRWLNKEDGYQVPEGAIRDW